MGGGKKGENEGGGMVVVGESKVLYLQRNLWSPYLPEAGSEIQAIAVKYFSLMEFFSINFIRMDQPGCWTHSESNGKQ